MKDESAKSEKFIGVGWLKDAHGIKGEVFVGLNAKKADWLESLTVLRLVSPRSGVVTEFEVLAKSSHKDGLILKLKGLSDRTSAEALRGLSVEIPESYLISKSGESIFLNEILGFEVVDARLGSLGPIVGFESNGAQDLLVLKPGRADQLVPFVDAFVSEIQWNNKKIEMNLPEGLVDLGL